MLISGLLLFVIIGAQPAAQHWTASLAPDLRGASGQPDSAVHDALDRVITLELHEATLTEALDRIGALAAVDLTFNVKRIAAVPHRITIKQSVLTVRRALAITLNGTGFTVRELPDNNVVIVPGSPETDSVRTRRVIRAGGTISGRVIDSETRRPIVGAAISLGDARRGAMSGDSGTYRFTNLAAGTYTVRARRLGYVASQATATIVADEVVTVDLALAKSPSRLDEVVVTGTMVPTEIKELPSPISVISDSEITQQHPHNFSELFRQAIPTGVSFDVPSQPEVTSFSVRGASTLGGNGQMKVFIDGVETATPSDAAVDLSSIDRIEVIRGPQAATLYGPDAIGGVIQVFTKRGDPSLTHPQINADVAASDLQTPYADHGNVLRQEYSAAVRDGSSDMGYNLGAHYTATGNYLPNGEISREYSPSFYGGTHFTRGQVTLDASGRYFENDDPSVYNPALAQTKFSGFTAPDYEPVAFRNETFGARLNFAPLSWWQHTVTIGVDQFNQDDHQVRPRFTFPGDSLLNVSNFTYTKTSFGYVTSVQHALSPAVGGSITAGLDHYSLPITFWYTSGAANSAGGIQPSPGSPISADRSVTNNTGYFAQVEVSLEDVLFLTGGLRAENNSEFGSQTGTAVSPRGGISFVQRISDATLKFRGSWGRALRAPSPGEKAEISSPTSVQLSNLTLGPERQSGWDAGVDVQFGRVGSLSFTHFDQTADNLIDQVTLPPTPTDSVPTFQYENVGRVRNSGYEAEGSLDVGMFHFKGQYGYTFSRIERLSPTYQGDLRVGDRPFTTPAQTGGAFVTVAPLRTSTLSAGVTYVGTYTYYNYMALFSCYAGSGPCRGDGSTLRPYITGYPAFAKLNVTVAQVITSRLSSYLSVDNLTNNTVAELSTYAPVWGRITTLGFRVQY